MNFSFKTEYSFYFILLVLIASAIISYLYYRNSKLDSFKKKLFTVLRILSVFLFLMLLLSPVISFISSISRVPVNIFLIDNSQSLLIDDRSNRLKETLTGKLPGENSGNAENKFYLFSGNLIREIRSNEFSEIEYSGLNNYQTNLTKTISSLNEMFTNRNISSLTIISDGIINDGGNPEYSVKNINAPVNYILTGDTIQKNDLVLKNVYYNNTSFIESKVPVKAEINSYNYNKIIRVNLYEENKKIDSKEIKTSTGQISYEAEFSVSSNTESVKKYKIEIEKLEDEITDRNNFKEFFIKFTDNKFKILMLSGGPGADNAFIGREIKSVKNFESTFLTQKTSSEFYEGTFPADAVFDCYVFIGFPTSLTNPAILNGISENIRRDNSALIFFSGRNTDYTKLSLFENNLPFKAANVSSNETETGISVVNSDLTKNLFPPGIINSLKTYPNIFKTSTAFSINPASETLLLSDKNSEPAMVMQNTGTNKSVAFLVHGFYRWKLNSKNTNAAEIFNNLLTKSIITVSDKEAKNKFRIQTTKPVYSKYENVAFNAFINNYKIKTGDKIKVNIRGIDFNEIIELRTNDGRTFEGQLNVPADGDYEYTAELISSGNTQESIQNRFAIGEDNYEFRLTRADNSLLSSIANITGGRNLSQSDKNEIEDALKSFSNIPKEEISSFNNFELNINPYYLSILIFLLSLEWFLRKRNNLP